MNTDPSPSSETPVPDPVVEPIAPSPLPPDPVPPEPAPLVPEPVAQEQPFVEEPAPVDPILQDYAVRCEIEEEILRMRLLLESKDQLTPDDFSK